MVAIRIGLFVLFVLGCVGATFWFAHRVNDAPRTPPWKEALDKKTVIRLEDPPRNTTSSPLSTTARLAPTVPQADRFEVPARPSLPEQPASIPVETIDSFTQKLNVAAPPTAKPASAEDLVRRARLRLGKLHAYSGDLVVEESAGADKTARQVIRLTAHVPSGKRLYQWVEGPHTGRVVLEDPSLSYHLQVKPAPTDKTPGGFTGKVKFDDPLARVTNRQNVTKLGLAPWIEAMEKQVRHTQDGDRRYGTLFISGLEKPPQLGGRETWKLRQQADEAASLSRLPSKGYRDWYIDKDLELPMLVSTHAGDGALLESIRLTDFKTNPPVAATDLKLPTP